jgi:hypothetical protein
MTDCGRFSVQTLGLLVVSSSEQSRCIVLLALEWHQQGVVV